MEGKKYFLAILGLFLIFNGMASNKDKIYEAYISGDMQKWKTVIDHMQRQTNNSPEFLIELVNYQYGFIGWCIGMEKNSEAKKYIERAENNLEKLEKQDFSPSEISAYRSAIYGFKIGISPIKAPILGPKSVNYSKFAMEQDESNPMGYIQYGNSQFYMPTIFGGSKKEALKYFNKALELMEAKPSYSEKNWNYLSLLTIIAQSYEAINDKKNAERTYKKILNIEPDFDYVKNKFQTDFYNDSK